MKNGFLITARLKSTRLPLKILKDLNGKSVVERLIDRIKEIEGIDEIILCTSTNPQDRELIDIAINNGIQYFTGDEDDVLQRLLDASEKFQLDYFMGITADNPLISIRYSNDISRYIKENKYDFIKLDGLPIGSATYGWKVKALKTVCKVKKIIDTEIWGYLVNRPELFEIKSINVEGKLKRPELRFTMDYPEDYQFINNIYTNVPFDNVLDLYNVMDYLDANPNTIAINKNCIQRDLDVGVKNQIDQYYKDKLDEIKIIKDKIYSE